MDKEITIPAGSTWTFTIDTTCEICKQVIGVNVPLRFVVNYDEVRGFAHEKCLENIEN